jgi:hypothetical protein
LIAQHRQAITNFYGFPKTFYCDDDHDRDRYILETCMYFPFTTAKSLAGFGAEHSRMMSDMRRLQMILVLVSDRADAGNYITVDRAGGPILHYSFPDDILDAFIKAQVEAAKIFFAAGAKFVHAPASGRFLIGADEGDRLTELIGRRHLKLGKISISSAHPMGGCRMGSNPQTSVTDIWGKSTDLIGCTWPMPACFPTPRASIHT